MSVPMVIALLVATAVLGAKPTLRDVMKKFPAQTLPITIKELTDPSVKLTAAEVEPLGFLQDTSESLSGLRDWKKKSAPDVKKVLWPIAAIQRTNYQVLLLRYDEVGKASSTRSTYLLVYGDAGLRGGMLFHVAESGEAIETNVSTLDQAGVVSRLITAKHPLREPVSAPDGGVVPTEFVVTAEQRAKLTSTGVLEVMPRAWSRRNGLYVDRKSNEEFLALDKRVFYRAEKSKPSEELEGDGNTMRLKGSTKSWVLTWNDRRSEISVQNPEGLVQVFTREW